MYASVNTYVCGGTRTRMCTYVHMQNVYMPLRAGQVCVPNIFSLSFFFFPFLSLCNYQQARTNHGTLHWNSNRSRGWRIPRTLPRLASGAAVNVYTHTHIRIYAECGRVLHDLFFVLQVGQLVYTYVYVRICIHI